jgi:hypothetical protein
VNAICVPLGAQVGVESIAGLFVSRRTFDADKKMITNSFIVNKRPDYPGDDYATAVKVIAEEMKVPLVDLQASSAKVYEALGDEASHKLFANAGENTHHSDYGSYEIAKCVMQGIIDLKLPIAQSVTEDWKPYERDPEPATAVSRQSASAEMAAFG